MGWGVRDYPTSPEPRVPVCPVCGEECGKIVVNENHEVLGCDNCLDIQDAWFWMEENDE